MAVVFMLSMLVAAGLFDTRYGLTIVRLLDYDSKSGCDGTSTEKAAYIQDECHIHGRQPGVDCDAHPACAKCMAETPGPSCGDLLPEAPRSYRKIFCDATHFMVRQYNDSACSQAWSDEMYNLSDSRGNGQVKDTQQLGCKTVRGGLSNMIMGHEMWECNVQGTNYLRLDRKDGSSGPVVSSEVYRNDCHTIMCGVTDSASCSIKRACTQTGWTEAHYGTVSTADLTCSGSSTDRSYNLKSTSQVAVSRKYITKKEGDGSFNPTDVHLTCGAVSIGGDSSSDSSTKTASSTSQCTGNAALPVTLLTAALAVLAF
jgi:hypothetical protein